MWSLHVLPVSVWVSFHSPKTCGLGTTDENELIIELWHIYIGLETENVD